MPFGGNLRLRFPVTFRMDFALTDFLGVTEAAKSENRRGTLQDTILNMSSMEFCLLSLKFFSKFPFRAGNGLRTNHQTVSLVVGLRY